MEVKSDGTSAEVVPEEAVKVIEIRIRFNNGLVLSRRGGGEEEVISAICQYAILRSNIIETAWIAIRKDEVMQLYYLNNCKKMVASKAIVKAAKKHVN